MLTFGPGYQAAQAVAGGAFFAGLELRIYDGTAPANAKAALAAGNNVLATHTLDTFTVGATSITADSIPADTIDVGGSASFVRVYKAGVCELQATSGDVTFTPDNNFVQNGESNVVTMVINYPSE